MNAVYIVFPKKPERMAIKAEVFGLIMIEDSAEMGGVETVRLKSQQRTRFCHACLNTVVFIQNSLVLTQLIFYVKIWLSLLFSSPLVVVKVGVLLVQIYFVLSFG